MVKKYISVRKTRTTANTRSATRSSEDKADVCLKIYFDFFAIFFWLKGKETQHKLLFISNNRSDNSLGKWNSRSDGWKITILILIFMCVTILWNFKLFLHLPICIIKWLNKGITLSKQFQNRRKRDKSISLIQIHDRSLSMAWYRHFNKKVAW